MEKVTITVELANAILGYLGTKPYTEVAGLVAEIQKQANEKKEPELKIEK